jgi:hypothetical protein
MIQGNGIVQTIAMTKHLGINMKSPKVIMWFDYHNGITNEEEDLFFASDPKLFSIGIINLPLKTLNIVVINTIQRDENYKNYKLLNIALSPFQR